MVACECELIIGPFVSLVDGLEWHVSEPLAGLDANEMVEQPCLGVKRYCPQMRLPGSLAVLRVVLLVLVIAHPPHHFPDKKSFSLSSNAFLES